MQSDTIREAIRTYRRFRAECEPTITDAHLEIITTDLHQMERELHLYAEYACNGELTNRQITRQENLESLVKLLAAELGFAVKLNNDPRGGAIRFVLPSKASNNWDNETWGIYY